MAEVRIAVGADGLTSQELADLQATVTAQGDSLATLQSDVDTLEQAGPAKSAYQSAVDAGFVGTEAEWVASLSGTDGYTPVKGTDYNDGANGLSAYQVAVDSGFSGTEAEWVASLKGANGSAPQFIQTTQAAYDALSAADKNDPLKIYVIPSAN